MKKQIDFGIMLSSTIVAMMIIRFFDKSLNSQETLLISIISIMSYFCATNIKHKNRIAINIILTIVTVSITYCIIKLI
jgi:CHASE2 domain-containing sensor protein